MEYQVKVRGQIMQAMMYPLIMIFFIVIIIGMLVLGTKLQKSFKYEGKNTRYNSTGSQ